MKAGYQLQHGKTGIEMVEEASHLVRRASPHALACYYIGTAPFVAGLLFFWSAMSRSPFASEYLMEASLGLALLFLWMKGWQAGFTRVLIAEWSGNPVRMNLRRAAHSFVIQGILQPSAFFILPIAALILLPFPWAYAFYQNVTALDDGEKDLRTIFRQAARQATLWPRQNTILLLLLSSFGFFVFLNWFTFCATLPSLLKTLFGIESMASESPASLFNSTLLAAVVSFTYLCVDPLLKAGYALRCFYGSSLQSGEDLKTELRFLTRIPATVMAIALLLLGVGSTRGNETASPSPGPATASSSVAGQGLDRSIAEVLKQEKYTWRMAVEKQPTTAKKGVIRLFFDRLGEILKKTFEAFINLLRKIWHFFTHHNDPSRPDRVEDNGSIAPELLLLFIALAVVASILGVVLMRHLRARRAMTSLTASVTTMPVPDLADEYISADQFPEDKWTAYGRELMAKGDLRSALRAFYLAGLAHLGSVNLITIARGKSNREYEKEVARRGHALPELPPVFGENVRVFDRAWYGLHEVNLEMVEHFLANLTKIKGIS